MELPAEDEITVDCVICKENLLDHPTKRPVIFAPCESCDVLYCDSCLEANVTNFNSKCTICGQRVRLTRSTVISKDGSARLAEHAAKEREKARPAAPVRLAPEGGELAYACVNPHYLKKRQQEDNEAESRMCPPCPEKK